MSITSALLEWLGLAPKAVFHIRAGLPPSVFTPTRATDGSSGYDLRACLPEPHANLEIVPGAGVLVSTGVSVAFAPGWRGVTYDRSSFRKGGISQLGPGLIDTDYTGEICIVLRNLGPNVATIAHGDRIAQLVLERVHVLADRPQVARVAGQLGGFGSTGTAVRGAA